MAEQKKYLDFKGLGLYDVEIKKSIDAKDVTVLANAKTYADGLAGNYEPSGSVATALNNAKSYTDGEVAKVNATIQEVKTKADKATADIAQTKQDLISTQSQLDALDAFAGELPEEATAETLVGYIQEKTNGIATDAALKELQSTVGKHTGDITALKAKDTELEGEINALEPRVATVEGKATANENAIQVLNGTGSGSVKKAVDDALNAFATNVSNDNVVNTFKELVDYCATHSSEVAEMAGNISKNKGAITKLETYLGKLPEGTKASDVIAYINELVTKEQTRAQGVESGLDTRIKTLEGKLGEGEGSIAELIATAKAEAIATSQSYTNTEAGKAKSGAVADAKTYTDTEVGKVRAVADKNTADITALKGSNHTHENKAVLDGITSDKVDNWDNASTKAHEHANKAVLDGIDDAKVTDWTNAEANAKSYVDTKIAEFKPISREEIASLFATV